MDSFKCDVIAPIIGGGIGFATGAAVSAPLGPVGASITAAALAISSQELAKTICHSFDESGTNIKVEAPFPTRSRKKDERAR